MAHQSGEAFGGCVRLRGLSRKRREGGVLQLPQENAYNRRMTTRKREESMATGKALDGKPYAGNPHVRFDEGEVAQKKREKSSENASRSLS